MSTMTTTTEAADRPSPPGSAGAPDMSGLKTMMTTEVPDRPLPPESAGALAMSGPKTTMTLTALTLTALTLTRGMGVGGVLQDHLRRAGILPTPLLAPLHLLRATRDMGARRGADLRGHRILARRPTPRAATTALAHPPTQVGTTVGTITGLGSRPGPHHRLSRQIGVIGRRWMNELSGKLMATPLSLVGLYCISLSFSPCLPSHHRRVHLTGLGVPGLLGLGG